MGNQRGPDRIMGDDLAGPISTFSLGDYGCKHLLHGIHYFTSQADDDLLHGDFLIGLDHGLSDDRRQALATGDFHNQDGNAFNQILPEYLCEFIHIGRDIIELRASHEDHLSHQKILMESGIGHGGTVGGDQQVGIF